MNTNDSNTININILNNEETDNDLYSLYSEMKDQLAFIEEKLIVLKNTEEIILQELK